MIRRRSLYFDFLKGIAILMVIAIHTFVFQKVDNVESFLHTSIREVCNVAVPLFLAISGYFIGEKVRIKENTYIEFLSKQLPRVYIPLLMWSLPMIIIWIIKGHDIFLSVAKGVLCMAHGPYYFIALIMQLYLLTPIFIFIRDKYYYLGGGTLLIINMISVLFLVLGDIASNIPFVFAVSPFIYWMMFYYTGLCLSHHSRNYKVLYPFLIFILGFVLQMCSTLYLQNIGYDGIGIKVSAWIYAWGLILFLFSKKVENLINRENNILYRIIVQIGFNSFGIYLVHVYSLILINKMCISLVNESWLLYWILSSLVTIGFVFIVSKLVSHKLNRILGLI